MIVFRHADPRLPFLRADPSQPAGRWHDAGEGPANYFADTPDGAWADLLRHEDITEPADIETIRRALWAVELPDDEPAAEPALPRDVVTGGLETYAACRDEARRLRATGATRLEAPSAALLPGGAAGHCVRAGLEPGPTRDGRTIVVYSARPNLVGWRAAFQGRPSPELLARVQRLRPR
jgi:hypothetical protein